MPDLARMLLPRWVQQDWMAGGSCRGRTSVFFPPYAERPQARVRREARGVVRINDKNDFDSLGV